MKVISILNHKGGVGKSTIATNLAGYYANQGKKVLLGDFDIQQSSRNWLNIRSPDAAPILSWDIEDGKFKNPPDDTDYIIIDSPAGIRDKNLSNLVAMSDKIVSPIKPGIFDFMSTQIFLSEICEMINEQEKPTDLCVIGNMVDSRTKSAEQLVKFAESTKLKCPTHISQGQVYVQLAAYGLTIFDSKSNLFVKDVQQWKELIDWLEI